MCCRGLELTSISAVASSRRLREEYVAIVPSVVVSKEDQLLLATGTNNKKGRERTVASMFGGGEGAKRGMHRELCGCGSRHGKSS